MLHISNYGSKWVILSFSLMYMLLGMSVYAQDTTSEPDAHNGLIIYHAQIELEAQKYQSELFQMNPDGSNNQPISNLVISYPNAFISDFSVSPDASQIAVLLALGPSLREQIQDLFLINRLDGSIERLTNDKHRETEPRWSPDGSQLMYTVLIGGGQVEIYIVDMETREKHELKTSMFGSKYGSSWSPDGTQILFQGSFVDAPIFIGYPAYLINVDGTNRHELISKPVGEVHYETDLGWSLDGTQIVYVHYPPELPDQPDNFESSLYIINSDGTENRELTDLPGIERDWKWSPDGTRIAFTQWPEVYNEHFFYVMNADGSQLSQLTFEPLFISVFTWSPDGTQIAFSSYEGEDFNIYVMSDDGSNLHSIPNDLEHTDRISPVWVSLP